MQGLTSRPYQPVSEKCCDACVFGSGEHAPWCAEGKRETTNAELCDFIAGLERNAKARLA